VFRAPRHENRQIVECRKSGRVHGRGKGRAPYRVAWECPDPLGFLGGILKNGVVGRKVSDSMRLTLSYPVFQDIAWDEFLYKAVDQTLYRFVIRNVEFAVHDELFGAIYHTPPAHWDSWGEGPY
jgi:hypothetical protein